MSRTIFGIQLALSAIGMGIGAGMLWSGKDPAVYLPIVTSIIGYWLPAPTAPAPQTSTSSTCCSVTNAAPQEPPTPTSTPESAAYDDAFDTDQAAADQAADQAADKAEK